MRGEKGECYARLINSALNMASKSSTTATKTPITPSVSMAAATTGPLVLSRS